MQSEWEIFTNPAFFLGHPLAAKRKLSLKRLEEATPFLTLSYLENLFFFELVNSIQLVNLKTNEKYLLPYPIPFAFSFLPVLCPSTDTAKYIVFQKYNQRPLLGDIFFFASYP